MNKFRCYPQQLESCRVFAIESAYANAYAIKNQCLCHEKISGTLGISQSICTRNPTEPHKVSAPETSGTSPSIFSAKPSGTSQRLCTGTFRNLTKYLPRNAPEPHHASSPRMPGTSSGTLPEPHQVPAPKPSRT